MVLNFEKVDFNFVEQTINNTMMYILCSRDILEEEMKNIEGLKKNNLLEFFQYLLDGNKDKYSAFLNDLPDVKDVSEKIQVGFARYFCSLLNMTILTNMEDRNDFRDIVKARFFVFDEKQKKTDIVYLYKDNSNNKGKPAFYNNLSTICDTRLILEETKKIAHECINKYLKIYNNIEPMIVDFDKIFFGETEIRK